MYSCITGSDQAVDIGHTLYSWRAVLQRLCQATQANHLLSALCSARLIVPLPTAAWKSRKCHARIEMHHHAQSLLHHAWLHRSNLATSTRVRSALSSLLSQEWDSLKLQHVIVAEPGEFCFTTCIPLPLSKMYGITSQVLSYYAVPDNLIVLGTLHLNVHNLYI